MAICTPIPFVRPNILATVSPRWMRARMGLQSPTNFNQIEIFADGYEVGAARQWVAERVLEHDPVPEFLFFNDYDVILPPSALRKLIFRAKHFPDYDIFAGFYCTKNPILPEPLIYCGDGAGPFWNFRIGDLILDGVTSVGMGVTLIRTSLFEKLSRDKPWFSTTESFSKDGAKRGTEDIYFCSRAVLEAGAKILVDTSVYCGHIDPVNDKTYELPPMCEPIEKDKWLDPAIEGKKLAIDLGAGTTRRKWDGYRTMTTDLRPGVADYVVDTRGMLPFPDNHFDMVASSHHLEHLGRHEQEQVWAEMVRILKPGGRMEHIVPDIEWAAQHVAKGHVDEHVYNVLYGAQEQHGYAKELNTHFFGYTPAIAKALAEAAGLVDVETEGYKERPERGYNLIIRGVKPGGEAAAVPVEIPEVSEEPKQGKEVISMAKKTAKKAAPKGKAKPKASNKRKAA